MDDVLAQWEKTSKKVVSLDVAFEKIEHNKGFGDEYYLGPGHAPEPRPGLPGVPQGSARREPQALDEA